MQVYTFIVIVFQGSTCVLTTLRTLCTTSLSSWMGNFSLMDRSTGHEMLSLATRRMWSSPTITRLSALLLQNLNGYGNSLTQRTFLSQSSAQEKEIIVVELVILILLKCERRLAEMLWFITQEHWRWPSSDPRWTSAKYCWNTRQANVMWHGLLTLTCCVKVYIWNTYRKYLCELFVVKICALTGLVRLFCPVCGYRD